MTSDYWDGFYSSWNLEEASPFASFVMSEASGVERVVDLGTGNGRDAFFFATRVPRVVAVDRSAEAVHRARAKAKALGAENIEFVAADLGTPGALEEIVSSGPRTLFYARFFLHAIDDAAEGSLIRSLSRCCTAEDWVWAEFRTERDADAPKVHGAHFRRFLAAADVGRRMAEVGFEVVYSVEGQGMAKFGDEDPWVARMSFRKASYLES